MALVASRSVPGRGLGLAQVMPGLARVVPRIVARAGLGRGLAQIAAQVVAPLWAGSWPGSGPCLALAGHGWPNALFKPPSYTEMIRDTIEQATFPNIGHDRQQS